MTDKQTTKMTAAEAVDFLNVWGEAELKKAVADRSNLTDTKQTTDLERRLELAEVVCREAMAQCYQRPASVPVSFLKAVANWREAAKV